MKLFALLTIGGACVAGVSLGDGLVPLWSGIVFLLVMLPNNHDF